MLLGLFLKRNFCGFHHCVWSSNNFPWPKTSSICQRGSPGGSVSHVQTSATWRTWQLTLRRLHLSGALCLSSIYSVCIYTVLYIYTATNGQMMADASVSTQTSAIYSISVSIYISFYNCAILQIRFKYILWHFILLLLYQFIAVIFAHVTTCFWQIYACRQFFWCALGTLDYKGLSRRIGHDMFISSISSWVVSSRLFVFIRHSRTMTIHVWVDGCFLAKDWGYQVCTNMSTCPFEPR